MLFIIKLFAGLFLTSKLCCFLELSVVSSTRNRADIPGVLVGLFWAFEAIGILLFLLAVNIRHWCDIQLIIMHALDFTLQSNVVFSMRCNVVIQCVLAGSQENYSSFFLAIGWSPLLGMCWLKHHRVGIWRDNVVKEALRNRNAGFRCIFKQYLLISGSEVFRPLLAWLLPWKSRFLGWIVWYHWLSWSGSWIWSR